MTDRRFNKRGGAQPNETPSVGRDWRCFGCSVLYRLAEMGWTDQVVEKERTNVGFNMACGRDCPNFVGSWTMMKPVYSTQLSQAR